MLVLANAIPLIVTTAIAAFITIVIFATQTVRLAMKVSFCLITAGLALWNVNIYIADTVHDHLLFWNNLVFVWPTIAVVGTFMFVSLLNTLPRGTERTAFFHSKRVLSLFLVAVSLQLLAILSNRIFENVTYNPADGSYVFVRGVAYPLYVLGVLLLLGLTLGHLVGSYRNSARKSQERRALMVVMLTIAVAALYSLITNVAIPVITDSQKWINLGTFALDIFSFGLALSIVRYRLFDIRFFVVRAAAYITTLFVVTFVFIAPFVLIINYLLGKSLPTDQLVLVVLLSVCLLYFLQSLRRFFDKATSRIFLRHYYDPQDVLDKLGGMLVKTANLEALREQTAAVLQDALKAELLRYVLNTNDLNDSNERLLEKLDTFCELNKVAMVEIAEVNIKDHGLAKLLREQNIALAVKLRTTKENIGYMILGHKQSGEAYNERDRRLLSVSADEIAIGLQNALRFEQIQRFAVTLQEEVDSKTRELKRKNKRLEELDNIKDDFISMASHQLRTPLTSVKGYLSMVLEGDAGKLNHDQSMMLKQAFTSSQRMVFLITDLLNVSRLKTGKFIIDAVAAKLDEIVDQELQQLYETAQAKNIQLTYDRPASFPELMLDEVKIRQVIMNFVDNAIYYTPEGGHIRVELEEKPATIELRVVDNGIGVPRSEQHHLFTKFYRATNARTARPDGTGLGLFMAQKVIVAQGGSVIFHSKEGQGSTFGFSFSKSSLAVKPKPEKLDSKSAKPAPQPAASK